MATLGALESIAGTDGTFSTFISAISAVKGMKDFADYLKAVRKVETILSNTIDPNTGQKYTKQEIITFIRRLYYPERPFDTACGSTIDEQGIADMLEQKSPGIMKSLGFSKRDAITDSEKNYRRGEEIWRADKRKYNIYGEIVDIGHIWTGIDAGANLENTSDLRVKTANKLTDGKTSILGVTITGDLVSTAGFEPGDLIGDLYGAVLGYEIRKLNIINSSFSLSEYLTRYFAPTTGRWYRVASDFMKIYNPTPFNQSWVMAVNAASINLRGKPIGLLKDDPYYIKNSELFVDYLSKMLATHR